MTSYEAQGGAAVAVSPSRTYKNPVTLPSYITCSCYYDRCQVFLRAATVVFVCGRNRKQEQYSAAAMMHDSHILWENSYVHLPYHTMAVRM